jgi:hypothetical protein
LRAAASRAVMPKPTQRRTKRKDRCGRHSGRVSRRSVQGDSRGGVVTGVSGASYCSTRTAADSRPRPGLAGSSTSLTLHGADTASHRAARPLRD